MPYTLRHYSTFAERITVYDAFSTDSTRDICKQYGATVVDWKTDGLNDTIARHVKSTGWINDFKSNWVICVDADEIIYFPEGVENTLHQYDEQRIQVVKPCGFEMFSETLPTTSGQIYDEIKSGARADYWYAKPVLFSPRRVRSIDFEAGAHRVSWIDIDGNNHGNPTVITQPPTWLLHYHHIGPIERIAARYDATRQRLSAANVKNRHGNFEPGMKHAFDKRVAILNEIFRVID
jgi:glycosyltransferase involved in cell wall biosynthesis